MKLPNGSYRPSRSRRDLGEQPRDRARPGWLDLPPTCSNGLLERASALHGQPAAWSCSMLQLQAISAQTLALVDPRTLLAPGRATWRALAGSIWPRLARSGRPGRPGCLDLSALVAPGRPGWLNLPALAALTRPGWLDLAARNALACLDLLDLAVLNSFARAAWLDLNANDGPNA